MPLVPVQRSQFLPFNASLKKLSLVLGIFVLACGVFIGWRIYTSARLSAQRTREQAYISAMSAAETAMKAGRPLVAVQALQPYLKTNPPAGHRYQALISLGYAQTLAGQDREAFATFKQVDAMQMTPPNVHVLRALGQYYAAAHDQAKAVEYYQKAIDTASHQKFDPETTPYIPEWQQQLRQLKAAA